jgi:hypothetical protein
MGEDGANDDIILAYVRIINKTNYFVKKLRGKVSYIRQHLNLH